MTFSLLNVHNHFNKVHYGLPYIVWGDLNIPINDWTFLNSFYTMM